MPTYTAKNNDTQKRQLTDILLTAWLIVCLFIALRYKKVGVVFLLIFAFPLVLFIVQTRLRTIKNDSAETNKLLDTVRSWALATKKKSKKAILIGINEYEGKPLQGAINDTQDAKNFLMEFGNLEESDIIILNDAAADKKTILTALDQVINNSQAGDTIYVWYSGHRSQITVKGNNGEADRIEEAMNVYGYSMGEPDETAIIADSELQQLFAKMPNAVKLIWVMDACHAQIANGTGKSLPKSNLVITLPTINIGTEINNDPQLILLAACKANEVTLDLAINGKSNGIFSYLLLQNLRLNPKQKLDDLIYQVTLGLRKLGYTETPEIWGAESLKAKSFVN